ncbi:uncharacterized protein LOC122069249 isoform X2 [Macadamia integrifolia]|uniref:uncharacterized protein LOC122069249 isoform X2 n=1 Tax=Macadamia integrifolia TaxID=60698 RepID=UPI001C4F5BC9|nr:uncharacterized protein LOC122069249 isoform X2 [Macadamia integrifolia]
MDDSGAILCQISSLKDMLDHVNEEIEANIQTTRDIESELVKCSEIESCFVMRESNLMKAICVGEFDVNSLIQVKAAGATSLELLEKELSCLRMKREEAIERMAKKREAFVIQCRNFQRDIVEGENEELKSLLLDKDLLEIENDNLNAKNDMLRNSMSAFVEEILGELHGSNSGAMDFPYYQEVQDFITSHHSSFDPLVP